MSQERYVGRENSPIAKNSIALNNVITLKMQGHVRCIALWNTVSTNRCIPHIYHIPFIHNILYILYMAEIIRVVCYSEHNLNFLCPWLRTEQIAFNYKQITRLGRT